MAPAPSGASRDGASDPVRRPVVSLQIAVLAAIAGIAFLWLGSGLPRTPWLGSDSDSYLQSSPVRPHGYPLFLVAYRSLFDDLAHLPSVQLGLYVGAVFFLSAAIGWRTQSFLFGVTTLAAVLAGTDTTNVPYLLSDTVYAAATTAAVACFVSYAGSRRVYLLLLAGAALGLAITFRSIGLVLLPALFVAVLVQDSGPPQRFGRRWFGASRVAMLALATFPIALLYCGAASSQLLHNGRFVLGSWGGMDVLGKIPLLSRQVPASTEVSRLNDVVEAMRPARDKLGNLSPLVEALAARQYYDYLRWYVILPDLERRWPAWRDADSYGQGQLAGKVAMAYVAEDPFGFLRLTALDLAGLWTMPRWLTEREQEAAQAQVDRLGEWPLLSQFWETEEGRQEYYKIVADPIHRAQVYLFRVVVAGFWVLSLAFVGLLLRHRMGLLARTPDLVFILLAVHAAYLGTALMEGVYERYIMPTWPLLVAGPLLALGLIRRRAR